VYLASGTRDKVITNKLFNQNRKRKSKKTLTNELNKHITKSRASNPLGEWSRNLHHCHL